MHFASPTLGGVLVGPNGSFRPVEAFTPARIEPVYKRDKGQVRWRRAGVRKLCSGC